MRHPSRRAQVTRPVGVRQTGQSTPSGERDPCLLECVEHGRLAGIGQRRQRQPHGVLHESHARQSPLCRDWV